MSYTKTYNTSITCSGTVTVHYPASEHGGSITESYHHTEPVTIGVTVDTNPFDLSIGSTNKSLKTLTGAVVGMESAQCMAIANSADRITNSLVNGFYDLVNSNISVQKAEMSSSVQSKFALLMQFSKDLVEEHQRMEGDVSRLKSHYAVIFNKLDEDCEKRIRQLDKYSFDLSENVHEKLLIGPYRNQSAFGYSQIGESSKTENLILLARLRKKVADVVGLISDSAVKSLQYQSTVSGLTEKIPLEESEIAYMPVVYSVADLMSEEKHTAPQYYAPEMNGKDEAMAAVSAMLDSTSEDKWTELDESEYSQIESEFMKQVENLAISVGSGDKTDRIYNEIMSMWKTNKLYTIA